MRRGVPRAEVNATMAQRNKLLTKTEYAARIGVNKSQISRYCAKGMPTHAGMIDPEEADWWREQNLDQTKPRSKVTPPQQRKAAINAEAAKVEQAAQKPTPPAKTGNAPAAPAVPDDLSGAIVTFADGTSMDLVQIGDLPTVTRIDKFWAGELKRRDAMQRDREHIPRADVEAATGAAILQAKSSFMGLSRRIAGRLEGKPLAERERIIQDEIRKALETLVRKLGRVADGQIDDDGSGAESADGDEDDQQQPERGDDA